VFAVYGQTATFDFFAIDDGKYLNNPVVARGLTREGLWWAFSQFHAGNWHPATWLSHMLDVSLFGHDAGSHHLVNVFFHALNSILLFAVMMKMTGRTGSSALLAALFALHPVNVESVAWIAERKNLLSQCFALLTISAYVGYVRRPSAARYGLVFLGLAAGLAAKPMLVTFPFVLLLLDFWPLKRIGWKEDSRAFAIVLEKLPLLLLAAAVSWITWRAQSQGGMIDPLERFPLLTRLAAAPVFYVQYLKDLFWPTSLYFYRPHPGMPPPVIWVPSLAALSLLVIVALWKARAAPFLFTGTFWFLGTLVPVIGLVQLAAQGHQDRYLYFPGIGIFLLVVWGAAASIEQVRNRSAVGAAWTVAIAVLLVLGYGAHRQAGFWRNSQTVYQHIIDENPSRSWAYVAWGYALYQEGKHLEAFRKYRKALEINPDNVKAHGQIALMALEQGSAIKDPGRLREKAALFAMARFHLNELIKRLPKESPVRREKEQKLAELNLFFEALKKR
jgi:hypothetical protein